MHRLSLFSVTLILVFSTANASAVVLSAGDIIMADHTGFSTPGRILRINPVNGQQAIISNAGALENPTGIAFDLMGIFW